MKRLTPFALAIPLLLSGAPAASADWTHYSTTYVPFNATCSQATFQFWDGYIFPGVPAFYTWPDGSQYPCAQTVDHDQNGSSVARASLVSIGDRMQGSATAQSSSSSVAAQMAGTGLYAETWVHVGICTPYVWLQEGWSRIAGRAAGSGRANGFAELNTSLYTGAITATVDVIGPGQTFAFDARKLPYTGWFQEGLFSFQETTWGWVQASAVGAGNVGRAELRAEVYVRAGLFENCKVYRGPGHD